VEGPYEFIAHQSPASPFTDAVRIVQNTVSTLLSGKSRPVLCVTSALPQEGKTLLSILLGTVIASEDKKVLLVDSDLRKPRIHQLFERDAGLGLSDLVTGAQSEISKVVETCHIPGLFVLTAGSSRDNPLPLLKNPRFREIMDACRNAYDEIILDAPPILGVADARVLSSYADGTILVSRAGHTPVEVLRQAKDALMQVDGRILGIVLNMVTHEGHGYSYYGRRYYGGRYGDHYGGYHRGAESGS
jgi:capsular exopolysaccharide synthesis family protein